VVSSVRWFLLAACFVLFFVHINGESNNDEKFRQLQKMAQRSPVIHISSSDTYNKLVADAGRNYSIIALFTATASKFNCGPCVSIAEEMKSFGVSYEVYFGNYQSEEFLAKPLFLAQLEPDGAMEIFQSLGFTTVPHFVYIPPGTKKVTKFRDDQFLRNPQTTVQDMINFVKEKTAVDIPLYQPLLERFLPLGMVIVLVVLVVRLARMYTERLYDPMLWYAFALVTYMIVMAGVVYNRIRNPPFMDMQNGRAVWISPSPRTQYVAEGILVAVVLAGAGVVFVALGDLVPRIKGAWKRRVVFWISAVLLYVFLITLNNIYHAKYHSSAFRLNWRFF